MGLSDLIAAKMAADDVAAAEAEAKAQQEAQAQQEAAELAARHADRDRKTAERLAAQKLRYERLEAERKAREAAALTAETAPETPAEPAPAPAPAPETAPEMKPETAEEAPLLPGGYLQGVLAAEEPGVWGTLEEREEALHEHWEKQLDPDKFIDVRTGKTRGEMKAAGIHVGPYGLSQAEYDYNQNFLRGSAEAVKEYFTSTEPIKNAARFPARVAVNMAEGVVAVPTLLAVGADALLKQAGSDAAEPVATFGMDLMRKLDDLKQNELEIKAGGTRLEGAPRYAIGGLELATELVAAHGLTQAAKHLGKKGIKTVVKHSVKQTAKQAAKQTAKLSVEKAAAEATARELGSKLTQKATAEGMREAAGVYTKHLTKEQLKEATVRAAKQLAKPDYYRVSIAARNGLETYEAYRQAGNDEGTAALLMLGDAATTYAVLGAANAAGSYSGAWTRSGYESRLARLLSKDAPAHLYLSMETGAAAMKIMAAGVSQAGSTAAHLKLLQGALGEEELSNETIAKTSFVNGLFGAAVSASTTIPALRQAYLADKEAALFKARTQGAPARGETVDAGGAPTRELHPNLLPEPGQKGWRPVAPNDGTPPTPHTPVAVNGNGAILFADGMQYRPLTNDFVTLSGLVTSTKGEVITLTPEIVPQEMTPPAAQPQLPAPAPAPVAEAGVTPSAPEPAPESAPVTPPAPAPTADVTPGADKSALTFYDLVRNGETRTVDVPVSALRVNDRIKQFKRDADAVTGVVEGEQLQGEYQTLPPKPIVVMEYADGALEVVTGRHRLDLAKRNGMETIPAAIIREVDGWTSEKARTLDALDNILDEKGDDRDFISFFRDSGIDRATAETKGLISRRKGRNAYAVATQGEQEIVDAVMNGDVAADSAAAVAREAPKNLPHAATVQRAVLKAMLERNMRPDDAGIMARSLMTGLQKQGEANLPEQGDLFGADDSALLLAEEEARYAARKRREAMLLVQRLNAAISKGDALALKGEFAKSLGITDPNDKVQIRTAIQTLKERVVAWENYFLDPVLAKEARDAAARAAAEAMPLFEQPDGTFLAAPAAGSVKPTAPAAGEEELPGELLDLASRPMADVLKTELEAAPTAAVGSPLAGAADADAAAAPVRPQGAGFGVAADHTPLAFGERMVTGGAYPYNGRLLPLGGAPDSPAMQRGLIKLSTFDLVEIFKDISGGHTPTIRKSGMRKALGRYWLGTSLIELRSQIFGLADLSDLTVLRDKLFKQGYFRMNDPIWMDELSAKLNGNKKAIQEAVDEENVRSNKALEKELKKLVDLRIRNRVTDGAGTRVMAHELWHMIDDQDGGLSARGNILGHLGVLKKYLKHTLEGFDGTRDELWEQAQNFVIWWRGTDANDAVYFMKDPAETIAEMGGAWFVDPASVAQRAPLWSQAFAECLRRHPKAQEAYDRAIERIVAGNSNVGKTLSGSWTPEYAQALHRIQEEIAELNNPQTWPRMVEFYGWDTRAPLVSEYKRLWRDHLAAGRQILTEPQYAKLTKQYTEDVRHVEKVKMDYTRAAPNKARLFLVDVQGVVANSFREVDPNPDVAWGKVSLYAHLNRVRGSLRGRATAYGVDAPTARKELVEMAKREGYASMRRIIKAAQAFHAVYEKAILEHPAFEQTFGREFYELCKRNTDYVTFKHTFTPEELEQIKQSLATGEPGKALSMIGTRLQELEGTGRSTVGWTKALTGSFRATLDPLQETVKTAVGILNCIEYNRVIAEFADAFHYAPIKSPFVRVYKEGKAIVPKGWSSLPYMRGGKRFELVAPKMMIQGFRPDGDLAGIKIFNAVSRSMSHYLTTALPSFIAPAFIRDISAARVNVQGLDYSVPGQFLPPVIGHGLLAAWGAFGKARWAQALSQVPGFNLVFNDKTLAYWLPIARETAKIIQTGRFAETQDAIDAARQRGDTAQADLLEYSLFMARHALGDGIFLHYANTRRSSYEKTDYERLQRKFNLHFGSTSEQMKAFARGLLQLPGNDGQAMTGEQVQAAIERLSRSARNAVPILPSVGAKPSLANAVAKTLNVARTIMTPAAAAGRVIDKAADISSEYAERLANTVKLAAYMSLHYHALGGRGYSEDDAEKIALKTIYDAGDPANENRGAAMGVIETFWRPFLNVALKCTVRPMRIIFGEPAAAKMRGDKAGLKEAMGEAKTAGAKLGVSMARMVLWSAVGTGALSSLILSCCAREEESEEETRERVKQTPILGSLVDLLDQVAFAQESSTRYIRENYFIWPVQNFPGPEGSSTSLVLTVPMDDDLKPAWLMVNAGLEALGNQQAIPGSGSDRLGNFTAGLLGFDNNQPPLATAAKLIKLLWDDGNPQNAFTGEHFFSDEASIDKTQALVEVTKQIWNLTPGRIAYLTDVRQNQNPDEPESEIVAISEAVRRYTPFFGDAFGRFVRVQRYGRTEAVKLAAREVDAASAELRLRAARDARLFLDGKVTAQELNEKTKALDAFAYETYMDAYAEALNDGPMTGEAARQKDRDRNLQLILNRDPDRYFEVMERLNR